MIHNGETVSVPSRGIEMGVVWMRVGGLNPYYTIRDTQTHELVKVTEDEIERCGTWTGERAVQNRHRRNDRTQRYK